MIESMSLNNFQAHKNTSIKFVPTLNVISGRSDSGKTSILRALNWITNGKPDGFDFHSHWCGHGDKTEVNIVFDNGYVNRWKSKSKNVWDCNGMELKATGKGVPLEVDKLINWSDINYCGQHDGAFLLNESDGKVAKKLNELVNLDIIDTTIGNLTSRIKATNKKVEVRKEAKDSINDQLERFEGLDEALKAVSKVDIIEAKYLRIDDDRQALVALVNELEAIERDMSNYGDLDEAINALDNLIHLALRKEELDGYINRLSRDLDSVLKTHHLLISYEDLDKNIEKVDCLLAVEERRVRLISDKNALNRSLISIDALNRELLSSGNVEEALEEVSSLIDLKETLRAKKQHLNEFEEIVSKVKILSSGVKSDILEITELEVEFKNGMGDKCPLCEKGI
tara:strand:- start:2073 stop:3263 length:1191 start_codon:yes stop_codon:yes gene_type:complete